MNEYNKVVWFEGMFLQPQHFQQHDRYLENLLQQKTSVLGPNLWGFQQLELNLELLSLGKIGIKSARGLFPDGTLFDIPHLDPAPAPIPIPEGMHNGLLYLALPLRQAGMAEVAHPSPSHAQRYQAHSVEVMDNAYNQQTSEVQVATLATRIMSAEQDLNPYTTLAIAEVLEAGAHAITLNQDFLPSLLDVHASSVLSQLLEEIHGLLQHRSRILAERLTDTQQAGTAEIIDFMLLQLVNKYEPYFHHLSHQRPLHPQQLFSTLLQLMGEMASFTHSQRRPIDMPMYQHAHLSKSFKPLMHALRQALSKVLEQNAISIKLEAQAHGIWSGQITDKTLLKCDCVLAVYAELPLESVRSHFPAQVKIAPVEHIRNLVSRALPGIGMNPIAVAPRQIPYHANFCYFALETQHELWQQLHHSAGIALHIGHDFPGLKLELWAIRG